MKKRSSYKRKYSRKSRKRKLSHQNGFLIFLGTLVAAILIIHYLQSMRVLMNIFLMVLMVGVIIGIIYLLIYFKKRLQEKRAFYAIPYLDHMISMDPFEFEHYVAQVFNKYGFTSKVTPAQADNGIDIWMSKDRNHYAVQVKRYARHNLVPEKEIRDFYGSFIDYTNTVGWFVTTSDFTQPAKKWAQGRHRLRLIDGNEFSQIVAGLQNYE